MKPTNRIVLLRWLASIAMTVILAVAGRATTVIPPDFQQLVDKSDYIVRAVVKSVTSEMKTDDHGQHIFTNVELDVREVIAGSPPQPLVLQMLGGTVGNEEMVVQGAPQFKVGDEDILFIHGNGRQFNPLVALMHGRYPVKRDRATGYKYMTRSDGEALYNENDVSQPMAHSAPAGQAVKTAAQPLSVDDFVSRIRNVARNIRHFQQLN